MGSWMNAVKAWGLGAAVAFLASCGGGDSGTSSANVAKAAMAMRAAAAQQAAASMPWPDLRRMRGVHMMGNWGGNQAGFRPSLVSEAPAITAGTVTINAQTLVEGAATKDFADVVLDNVQVGSGPVRAKAGFWLVRDRGTGEAILQFRPSLSANLAGIGGFTNGDVNIAYTPGTVPYLDEVFPLTGDARALVMAVIAHVPELVAGATANISGGSLLNAAFIAQQLAPMRDLLATSDDAYFSYLKSIHAEWLGISVGLHYDSYSNPDVVARNCASGWITDSGGTVTPCAFTDENLAGFIAKARARGFKVYLTLAFESSSNLDSRGSACGTAAYKMSRTWLGRPELPQDLPVGGCIAASNWWWNPAHPDHAVKVARFFQTYGEAAVRYAALAQSAGVELFSLGTETDFLFRTRPAAGPFTNHFRTQLQAMVAAVRGVYGGPLTYDMGYDVLTRPDAYYGADGSRHLFDDLGLDVVGLSAYFDLLPASPGRVLSVAELEAAWENIFTGYLLPLRQRYPSKPIVFTEFGYTDHVDAVVSQRMVETAGQAKSSGTVTDGMLQQRNIFEALFNVNARHGDLVSGFFFWGNDYFPLRPTGCTTVDWSFECNPARDAVAAGHKAWMLRDADRVFDWAQTVYPSLFTGTHWDGIYGPFHYRFYPATGIYLALKEEDSSVYLHDFGQWNMWNVGPMRAYLDMAAQAGW